MKVGILGGGLAGVSAAYFLQEKSFDVEVLEKEDECGGLCRSFSKNGFSYDLGGHIIFSKNIEILDIMLKMLGDNIQKLYRNNKIWFKNRFVKYPFENGLSTLDKEDIYDCLYGFIENKHPKPNNFKEWIYHTFGGGLAEKYLIPYNEKIWNTKAEKMGIEWVERIPKPPIEDVIKSALGIDTEGYTHQLYFHYPLKGGIQALISAFESKLKKVRKGFNVSKIKKNGNQWIVSDGKTEITYDRIISSMPIFDLAEALEEIPSNVKSAINKLKYNSLTVVLLGIDKKKNNDKFAVYFPQKEIVFHRICFHSYMGQWYSPEGKYSIVAEITTNPNDGVHELSDEKISSKVVDGLYREGLIDKKDVCETDVKRMKYGYVVHDLDFKNNTSLFRDYFNSIGIPLNGRFAEYEYHNMDQVVGKAHKIKV